MAIVESGVPSSWAAPAARVPSASRWRRRSRRSRSASSCSERRTTALTTRETKKTVSIDVSAIATTMPHPRSAELSSRAGMSVCTRRSASTARPTVAIAKIECRMGSSTAASATCTTRNAQNGFDVPPVSDRSAARSTMSRSVTPSWSARSLASERRSAPASALVLRRRRTSRRWISSSARFVPISTPMTARSAAIGISICRPKRTTRIVVSWPRIAGQRRWISQCRLISLRGRGTECTGPSSTDLRSSPIARPAALRSGGAAVRLGEEPSESLGMERLTQRLRRAEVRRRAHAGFLVRNLIRVPPSVPLPPLGASCCPLRAPQTFIFGSIASRIASPTRL